MCTFVYHMQATVKNKILFQLYVCPFFSNILSNKKKLCVFTASFKHIPVDNTCTCRARIWNVFLLDLSI